MHHYSICFEPLTTSLMERFFLIPLILLTFQEIIFISNFFPCTFSSSFPSGRTDCFKNIGWFVPGGDLSSMYCLCTCLSGVGNLSSASNVFLRMLKIVLWTDWYHSNMNSLIEFLNVYCRCICF